MSALKPRRPPPLTPKPGHVKVVRAMYRYDAQQVDELTFDEGDILYIVDMTDTNWWKAKCQTKTGLIPSNYVEEHTESLDFPLHEAAKRGNISFLQEGISNKVSVNGLDKAGSTPLHWAAHGGHAECVRVLMAVPRCEINVQNKLGDTPLHSAAWKGHPEVVKILLEAGCRTDIMNNEKKQAVDLAKQADTAALLKRACRPSSNPQGYGSDEDSD